MSAPEFTAAELLDMDNTTILKHGAGLVYGYGFFENPTEFLCIAMFLYRDDAIEFSKTQPMQSYRAVNLKTLEIIDARGPVMFFGRAAQNNC